MSTVIANNLKSLLYDFPVTTVDGRATALSEYRGQVLLIVNVASKCGFTPQYDGLEALFRKYKDRGVTVLGFPCNQFGGQEPGTEAEIHHFCSTQYNVTFPLFAKIDVNGKHADPLYVWLKSKAKGILGTEAIKWNFTKFLVDREGTVIDRYGSNVTPAELDPILARLTMSGALGNAVSNA
jgi:glutathione peroxidase